MWFMHFFDLQVRYSGKYNCAKFHQCRIFVTDFREGERFLPSPISEQPQKGPSLIGLIHTNFLTMITISLFYHCEKVFILWIYRWLGKIQGNIVTWNRIFSESFKCGRYYWCKVCKVCKVFKRISRFVWSKNTSLLADVFENFRNKCLKVYELDPAKFLSYPGLI